ncbi:MAG: DNA repair protein RadC [Bacteroidales bacterium]|nr:DNA repair protein RadC [Bacteroidales bacterium]
MRIVQDNISTSIKNWASDDRPREKLLKKGIDSLSDAELIAILIGSGNREMSAVELSKLILQSAENNLNELGKYSVHDLQQFKGIGEAKAISIIAALEIGKRRKISEIIKRKHIKSSNDIFEIFRHKLGDLPHEEFWLLMLNRANKIIDKKKISAGGVSGTVTDVKIILKAAIEKTASGIIVCHNHPSGNIKPSNSDINLTKKLVNACQFIEIPLLDHVIVSYSNYYSFADEGHLS